MSFDEVSFHLPSPNGEYPAAAKTLGDTLPGNVVEYDDQYQALRDATVMMVDDEPTTIEVLQAFLENEGYRRFVTTTQSTRAMDLLANENPDVVLLDLHMPEVTGFDILALVRRDSRYRHIPVIVLTSSNDSETKLKALQLGASDFLAKPVDPSELALRLRNTLAAKAYQDRLTYYDALTGLPNRRMFLDRLIRSLRCAKHDGAGGAVLHIDLDHFQKINDTLGHGIGDSLLIRIAQRLLQCVPAFDIDSVTDIDEAQVILSRAGGDEFNVFLPEIAGIENLAGSILAAMKEPFQVDGHEVFVTPTIGVAVFPHDGEASDTLLKHAGVAMKEAKQRGRNTYAFYSANMNVKAVERLRMENQLRRALDREELLPLYQPKVDIRTGRVVGTEALLRWYHPEHGLVSPTEFIPLAEETGLIVSFGEWVLAAACKQNKAWQSAGLTNLRISVNVVARQFLDGRFTRTLGKVLEDSRLEPQYLTLELTENTIMENSKNNLDTLHQIKAMGVKISVDDFGTGYSSLSYLKQLPLEELKIDRSFISEIRSETDDAPIVTAIVAMAHSLGLTVVMEGIETEQQLVFARDRGCDEYQGYLFSKPVTSREFQTMMVRT